MKAAPAAEKPAPRQSLPSSSGDIRFLKGSYGAPFFWSLHSRGDRDERLGLTDFGLDAADPALKRRYRWLIEVSHGFRERHVWPSLTCA